MKNGVLIIITAIITSLIWLVVLKESDFNHLRKLEKTVNMPTQAILSNLKATAASGNHALLKKKTDLLELKWRRYTEGGEGPSSFQDEVMNLKLKLPKAEKAK